MQPSPPPPPDSNWKIPDYVVDSPYDQAPARKPRSLHLGRRLLLAAGLLFSLAVLGVFYSLGYKSFSQVRLPSAAVFASTGLPDTSLPLGVPTTALTDTSLPLGVPTTALTDTSLPLGVPTTALPATEKPIFSSPTPEIPSPTPFLPSPMGLIPVYIATPSPEPGAAATVGPPQGSAGGYLLHQVQPGESLASLAEDYNTSIEVLTAANQPVQVYVTAQAALASADVQLQGATLPPGTLLVILPNQKDPAGVPLFEVVFLLADTSVSALADLESISAAELREINGLGDAEWIPAGRYLMIPRQ